MPQPTRGDVHVNAPLSNISVAYIQGANKFISTRFAPNIPVSKQSDRYYIYNRGDFNRDEMKQRAPGTETAGSGYDLDNTPTYYCDVWGFHKDIPDQVRANEDSVLNSDRDATVFVTNKALIRRERDFATSYLSSGVWSSGKTGVNSDVTAGSEFLIWNNANSDPINDIRTAKRAVLEATGFEPNKIVLGRGVYDALIDHPDIVDRVKYGQTPGNVAMVNAMSLAALFDLDEVLVSNAVYNSAAKGATESSAFINGSNALLGYVAPNPGLMTPSAAYTFSWSGYLGASAAGSRIKKFYIDEIASDRVEIEMAFDHKVVGADLGYFFDSAVDYDAVVSI